MFKSVYQAKLDIFKSFCSFEYISVVTSSPQIRLCVVYRPPSVERVTNNLFFDEFAELMSIIIVQKQKLLIVGDFNFHMNKTDDPSAIKFRELLKEFCLEQHVTEPTSKTHNMLDLVITRENNEILNTSPKVKNFISDHAAILCHLKFQKLKTQHKEFSYRATKDIDIPSFKKDIVNSDLVSNPETDLDKLVKQYNSVLAEILDKHAPLKICKGKIRDPMPWYNKSVKFEKKNMRRLERRWRKSNEISDYKLFSIQRQTYTKTLRKSKTAHFRLIVQENENNQKQLFNFVKKLSRSTKETKLPDHASEEELANNFGQFFIEK